MPYTMSLFIERGTVEKNSSPVGVWMLACLRTIAKTYSSTTRRRSVKNTERTAATMPLIKMIISGMERSSRAMRATLDKRSSRNILTRVALPRSRVCVLPLASSATTTLTTHVSSTMTMTKQVSKTNHTSFRQLRLFLKAPKRMPSSHAKKVQNTFSATMKTGSACSKISLVFKSASIEIQSAFTAMMMNVMCSNHWCRAMACKQPSVQ
mmetsp:Transcript_31842/g.93113  ORF Transcript_31842/g.93113 Transcript_31842/m.93113 type:complete len:209 (+) Transcript_31842:1467-2093(+)